MDANQFISEVGRGQFGAGCGLSSRSNQAA